MGDWQGEEPKEEVSFKESSIDIKLPTLHPDPGEDHADTFRCS